MNERPFIKHVDYCVDENIWGHRLHDEQTPHLTMLEFLGVLGSNLDRPLRPHEDLGWTIKFRPQRQMRLRGLLFNNPYVEIIAASQLSNEEKWRQWLEKYEHGQVGCGDEETKYLRQLFHEFDDFARVVDLLRATSFELNSNKRWSSKFVFPFGPDALYEDLQVDNKGKISNDRNFFGRTGELLYLMLTRAKRGGELGDILAQRLFDRNAPMNRLAKALQDQTQRTDDSKTTSYLPETSSARFDQMCEDWLAILAKDIPIYDALEHLITITGLNLLLYFFERAKHQIGDSSPVEFVCEIVSKERTKVRALSVDSYQKNQALPELAVRAHIEGFSKTEQWLEAAQSENPEAKRIELMRKQFQWPLDDKSDEEEDLDSKSPDALLSTLLKRALIRHAQHVGKIHARWSRAIGLSSSRLSQRIRYAPSDRLLKSIVVTVVDDRMQFNEFLAEVKRRYGLVFGDSEGVHLIAAQKIDQEDLSKNRDKLESRLRSLGLTRKLSDSCSFVENPFTYGRESAC